MASEWADGPESIEVPAPASAESRLRDYTDPAPADWLTVPPEYFRRKRAWKQFQREWYAQIGEVPEQNERQVEPERKGFHRGPEGEYRAHKVLTLDEVTGEYSDGYDSETLTRGSYVRDDEAYPGEEPGVVEYEPSGDEEYDEFVEDVRAAAGLTKGEAAAAAWVVRGNSILGADYRDRMGQSLGNGPTGAKRAWQKARDKLRDQWAEEPEEAAKPARRQYVVGNGRHPFTPDGPRRLTQFDTLEG